VNEALSSPGGTSGDVGLISLCTVKPLEKTLLLEEAARTGRVVVVQDEPSNGGYAPAVRALLDELPAGTLRAKPEIVARKDSFLPYAFEEEVLPTKRQVVDAIVAVCGAGGD
jgi:pyruvate/2-oxoglutarate/acetoin dehydrogenase E1 component